MATKVTDTYWKPTFETFYSAYYQELASEALIGRWQRADIFVAFIVAATASGSAIAGWTLWNTVQGKLIWASVAGIASVASIAHTVMSVPGRMKEQEEIRRAFCELRVDLETFLQRLRIGDEIETIRAAFEKLRERLGHNMGKTRPDIALTLRLRRKIQHQLNETLKERGLIK